jgi:hypothetical protein
MSERTYEQQPRDFTKEELAAMHDQLVIELGAHKELRSTKTQNNATINAQIKGAEKTIYDLQDKLAKKYEMVDIEVVTMLDSPAPGQKQILRVDNNIVLRTEPMTARERQGSFGFQEPE